MKSVVKYIRCLQVFKPLRFLARNFVALMIMILLVVICETYCYAVVIGTPPKVVMGTIEQVTSSSIRVNGKYYDISNVPILSIRGMQVTKEELKQGREVEIRFDGDKITSVIIKYKRYMVQ